MGMDPISMLGGGQLLGGLLGAGSAKSAADAQANAANNATGLQRDIYNQNQNNLSPYMQGGNTALSSLLGKMSDGSLGGSFTGQDYLNNKDPGYDFQLQQGQQALQNSQASGDGALGGSAMKGLINYNQGMASTGYQNAYQRWLSGQQNTFNQLSGIAGLGENAAAQQGNTGAQLGANMATSMMNAGNAQAGGIMGMGNAISGGLNGYAGSNYLNSLIGNKGIGSAVGANGPGSQFSDLTSMRVF